jgi:hypothetical protein
MIPGQASIQEPHTRFKNPLATGFKNPKQGSRTLATSEPFTKRVRVYAVVLSETRTQAIPTQQMRTRQSLLAKISDLGTK